MKRKLMPQLFRRALGLGGIFALALGSGAGAAGLDLQFVGGVNVAGGGTCALALNSRCRFSDVVVGAGTGSANPYQRDIVVTVTRLTSATLVNAFDDPAPVLSAGTPPVATVTQFFAPTVQPPQNTINTLGWAEFTFDVVLPGAATPAVGAGTASLPGTFWVSSFDTDGNGGSLREFVEFLAPDATGLATPTTLAASTAVDGGTQYQADPATQGSISVEDRHKASARYADKSSFKLVYGARITSPGTTSGGRLTSFDFFRPDSVLKSSLVEGYKSIKLITDADGSGTITPGDTLTWEIAYVNTGNADVTNFQITDTLPGNTTFTTGNQTVTPGTGSTATKNTTYNSTGNLLAGGAILAANSTIKVSIPVVVGMGAVGTTLSNQASAAGTNLSGVATDNVDDTTAFLPSVTAASGWTAVPASSIPQTPASGLNPTTAAVVAAPSPTIAKAFNPTSVPLNGTSTLTFTVTNPNPAGKSAQTNLNFTDALTGMNVAGTTLGGTCVAVTSSPALAMGATALNLTVPSLAANASCTITVQVKGTQIGVNPNTTSGVTSAQTPTAGAASNTANLTVTPLAPGVSKSFNPASVTPGSATQLTITVTNPNAVAATNFALTDDIAGTTGITGLTITGVSSDTCKGSGTVTTTSGRYALTGGTLPANGCSVVLNLQLPSNLSSGTRTNTIVGASVTGTVSGRSLPAAANAVADLSVTLPPPGPTVPTGFWSKTTCLDFTGVSLSANDAPITRTVTTTEDVVVTYTINVTSNAQYATGNPTANANAEKVLNGYAPGSWRGDSWDDYFGGGKINALTNIPVGRKVGYTLTAYATYNGQPIPITLLTGSAEDDGTNEYVKTTTNGTAFAVAERNTGTATRYGEIIVSNGGATVQMSVNSVAGNFLLIATTKMNATAASPLILTNEIAGNGATAQGFCLAFPYDRGDAPATYSKAAHLQNLTFVSPLTNTTATLDNLALARSETASSTTVYLGNQPSSEDTERGTNGTGDTDEGVTSLPSLNSSATTYSVPVAYTNTSGATATLAGWVDFNGNGVFDAGERASTTVGAGSGTATLTWNGVTITGGFTVSRYARFRISTDNTNLSGPSGGVLNGEVEDYIVQLIGASLFKTVTNTSVVPAATGTTVAGKPGDSLEYCIAFSNTGNAALLNFTVTDSVPGNTTGQGAAYGAGQGVKITRGAAVTYQVFANPVNVNLGTLAIGESGSICFTAKIN